MSTDPIKLVKDILTPKTSAKTPTGTATAASTTATSATGSTSPSDAYKLSRSLVQLMSQADSGTTQDLSNYTAKGLKDYFQSAHDVQTKEKTAAAATPKPLDDVLKASQTKGTNEPTLSAAAQAIVKEKKATATDAGLAATDQRLAQTVGISRAIGTA